MGNLKHFASPLVAFEKLFNELDRLQLGYDSNYPFYNIVRPDENKWLIEIATAGFSKENLSVELDNGKLVVRGTKSDSDANKYVWQSISTRKFIRQFTLPDTAEVTDVTYLDGILSIEITLPEAKTPKAKLLTIK